MKVLCRLIIAWMWVGALDLRADEAAISSAKAISFDQLGAEAQKQYSGDGITVTPTAEGAWLRSSFQKLEGEATREGLWLSSMADAGGRPEKFRVLATAVGRSASAPQPLAVTGAVTSSAETASFMRSALLEEYRVSMDGVRQDFVVMQRPTGAGELCVTLAVTGAQVVAADYGVKLTLPRSGREIGYSRLHVTDATGRELTAKLEVLAADRIAVCVEDAAAVYPVRIDPTFSDADWVSLNPGIPGTNGIVYAMAMDGGGNLYIGGQFTQAGGASANNVAKWNGTVWSALGSGMNNVVLALSLNGTDVYAGGYFTQAGDTLASHIAKWDGSTWSALGSGTDSNINALAMRGSNLYAGGYFTTAGGVTANRIAKWDGSAWSALGTGMDKSVRALAVIGADVYAGGEFTTAGGVAAKCIAKWDGSVWSPLGPGLSKPLLTYGSVAVVQALAVSGTTLYAGGNFTESATRIFVGTAAKWDGSTWSTIGGGGAIPVYALAVNGTDVYVGLIPQSGYGVSKWNGSYWDTALGVGPHDNPIFSAAYAMVLSGSDLYVGGGFVRLGNGNAQNVSKWDGSTWSALYTGINGAVRALAVSGSNLYAGGDFITAGGLVVNHIAKWDGSAWTALGTGINGYVTALQVLGTDLYAGGIFTMAGGGAANNIAKWDGSAWRALDLGVGSGFDPYVRALAVIGTDLYVGGRFTTAGSTPVSGIAKWDGSTWSALGTGVDGYSPGVYLLAVSGTNLYVGGYFTIAGGVPASNIAKWDGTAWSALGEGLGSGLNALAVSGTNLYAGMSYDGIHQWNGSSWSVLPPGNINSIYALAVSGTNLYVGGTLSAGLLFSAHCIEKWDGNTWSALGSGPAGESYAVTTPAVYALAVDASNHLFIGGNNFTKVGNNTLSPVIAQANLPTPTPDIAVAQAAALSDGTGGVDFGAVVAGSSSAEMTFTLTNPGDAELSGLSISVDGANAADFEVNGLLSTGFVPGSSVTFTVNFTPGVVAASSAALHIASNVSGTKNPFDISLSGLGVTANQGWQQQYFGVITGLGNAAPDADPNHNGIPNLLEYALGGDPMGGSTGASILPGATVNAAGQPLQINLKRYLERRDITLTVQAADNLAGPWIDLAQSANGGAFMVVTPGTSIAEIAFGNPRAVSISDLYQSNDPAHPRRFMRLKVGP
jgi:cortical protein marker for cell polarity/centrosomal CEP192-like protein